MCVIENNNVREWLIRNNEFTLKVAIYTVRAAGTSITQTEALPHSALEASAVNVNKRNKKPNQPRNLPPKTTDPKQSRKPCSRCGSHRKPREFKAFGYTRTCHKYQRKNHFANMFRAKKSKFSQPKSSRGQTPTQIKKLSASENYRKTTIMNCSRT